MVSESVVGSLMPLLVNTEQSSVKNSDARGVYRIFTEKTVSYLIKKKLELVWFGYGFRITCSFFYSIFSYH